MTVGIVSAGGDTFPALPRELVGHDRAPSRVGRALCAQGAPSAHSGARSAWVLGEAFTGEGVLDAPAVGERLCSDSRAALDGAFSAAVYDDGERELVLVADALAVRRLYYAYDGARFCWGFSAKSVAAAMGARDISIGRARAFLDAGSLTAGETLFDDVQVLSPGETIVASARYGDVVVRREQRPWWRSPPSTTGTPLSLPDAAASFVAHLRRAVRRRLGHETLVSLSGGLDSRAMAAVMPRDHRYSLITFGDATCNDVRLAVQTAAALRAPHEVVPIAPDNWLESRLPVIWRTDGEMSVGHMHGAEMGDRAKGRVLLTGAGAGNVTLPLPETPGGWRRWLDRIQRFLSVAFSVVDGATVRMPFLDAELLAFVRTLPRSFLRESRLYHYALTTEFPELYDIPWSLTMAPIDGRGISELPPRRDFVDYPALLRSAPARERFSDVLFTGSSAEDLVDRSVVTEAFERVMQGGSTVRLLFRLFTVAWFRDAYRAAVQGSPA